MTDVDKIALWTGLIASVVSIVMSLVAIAFAVLVDKRAREVSDQTIRSLQKIESAVERLSSDTRELIKAGWDRMLGSVSRDQPPPTPEAPAKELAAGIASELREELQTIAANAKGGTSVDQAAKLEQVLKSFEATLATQLRSQRFASRPSEALDQVVMVMSGLQPESLAIVRGIRRRHLTSAQYSALRHGPLSGPLGELRQRGLLVPVRGEDNEPAYYFPPQIAPVMRAALPLIPTPPEEVIRAVREELRRAGYRPDGGHDA